MKWRFVSSPCDFEDLKRKKFYFIFPSFGALSSGAFSLPTINSPVSFLEVYFLFLRFTFFRALNPPYPSLRNFFVGVCRVAESEDRPICFRDLIPADCVFRRLAEELFVFAPPAISTWRLLRGRMASKGSSWHEVRSEELPEGLSDRDGEGRSTDEAPFVSGSSKGGEPEKLWIARSYLSKVEDEDGLKKYRDRYQIPYDVVLRIPDLDERACSSRYDDVAFYEVDFNVGLRFPMQPLMRELLDHLHLALAQLAPNAWRTMISCMVLWQICSKGEDYLMMDELLYCYKPCQIAVSPGFWTLNSRERGMKLVTHLPTSNREWKDDYIFVYGDNWEALPWEEKDDSFIRVRRAWGTPLASGVCVFSSLFGRVILSSSYALVLTDVSLFIAALRRPKLDQDGINWVLRALHHREHCYTTFIQPEVLALYSLGLELNETVLSLQEINQKSKYLSSVDLGVLYIR